MKSKNAQLIIVLLIVGAFWLLQGREGAPTPTVASSGIPDAPATSTHPEAAPSRHDNRHERERESSSGPHAAGPYRIAGVTITDIHTGRRIPVGTVDLKPTLDRIAAGEKNAHRNDGTVYRNLSRKLPEHPAGYYREYVVPTEGVSGPGPQRLIVGRGGELYYTFDHYETFIRVEGD